MGALAFILIWLWLNSNQVRQVSLLAVGVLDLTGGIYFVAIFIVRRLGSPPK
jgi:hypothetical protein